MIDTELARLLFEQQKVIVTIRKKIDLKVAGIDLSAYEKGSRVKVPLWLAKVLADKGVVEISDENLINADSLMKALWREEHSPMPAELPEDFFAKLALSLRLSKEEGLSRIREKKQMELMIDDLMSSRLQKMLSAIRMGADLTEYLGNLTIEERILHDRLNRVLSEWRKMIALLLEGVMSNEHA